MDQLFSGYSYQNVIDSAGQLSSNELILNHVLFIFSLSYVAGMVMFLRSVAKPR